MDKCHAEGQSGLTGRPAWPGRGPPTRQEVGGVDCHTIHAYTSNCMALSCSSFVNSLCALTDFQDRKLFKLMTVYVIGSN